MGIDDAYARLEAIVAGLPGGDDALPIEDNEAQTRRALIDPILQEVLGWPGPLVGVELPAGGGRLDYVLRDERGECWFVVEAKKRSSTLVDPEGREGPFKLTGPVLKKTVWPIVDQQMQAYLGRTNAAFGAVTNGEQWVAFLARRRPAVLDLSSSHALVFRSLEQVLSQFELFYRCFSLEHVRDGDLVRRLEPEHGRGVLECVRPSRVVQPHEERALSYQDRERFYEDVRQAMDLAFNPILRDPDALSKCFVESRESRDADSRLERMATELQEALADAGTYPDTLCDEVEASTRRDGEPAPGEAAAVGQGYLARVVGEPSSGKSVFLARFFKLTLPERSLRDRAVLIRVDAEELSPFTALGASRAALEQAKRELFGQDGPTWSHYREVYSREWRALLRLSGETDEESEPARSLRQGFIAGRLDEEERAPEHALRRFLEFAVRNRRRVPCVVLDNVDHLPDPDLAIAWALAVHLTTYALTTVAMADTTLWRLSNQGRDQLRAHAPEQFWLSRPKVRDVLAARCAFLKSTLEGAGPRGERTQTLVGRRKAWRWNVDAEDLGRLVSATLLDQSEVTGWIGKLCNYDLQEILLLCKRIVLSPQVKAEQLLAAHATATPPSRFSILKAIITPSSEQYQGRADDPVVNIMSFWSERTWAPLLPARVLAWLRWEKREAKGRREPFPGFVPARRLLDVFDQRLGVPDGITLAVVEKLLAARLVETYEPSRRDLREGEARIGILPRGSVHLDWALGERTYLRLMAEVDPIPSAEAAATLRDAWKGFVEAASARERGNAAAWEGYFVALFVQHLLDEAARLSPVEADATGELAPLLDLETELRGAWLPARSPAS